MMLVYSRVGEPVTASEAEPVHYGWLRGASHRAQPYPRAWVANVSRGGDVWRDMTVTAPPPRRRPSATGDDQQSYILQQEANGQWSLDAWTSEGAGAIRSAAPAAVPNARAVTGEAADAVPPTPLRDMQDPCFIIELASANPR